jgi:hypothetical protein
VKSASRRPSAQSAQAAPIDANRSLSRVRAVRRSSYTNQSAPTRIGTKILTATQRFRASGCGLSSYTSSPALAAIAVSRYVDEFSVNASKSSTAMTARPA